MTTLPIPPVEDAAVILERNAEVLEERARQLRDMANVVRGAPERAFVAPRPLAECPPPQLPAPANGNGAHAGPPPPPAPDAGESADAAEGLPIPARPAAQRMTWRQWANQVRPLLRAAGCDVAEVLPVGLARDLYLACLTPDAAAALYLQVADKWRELPAGAFDVPDVCGPGAIIATTFGSGPARVIGLTSGTGPHEQWYSLTVQALDPPRGKPTWLSNVRVVDRRIFCTSSFEDDDNQVLVLAPPPAPTPVRARATKTKPKAKAAPAPARNFGHWLPSFKRGVRERGGRPFDAAAVRRFFEQGLSAAEAAERWAADVAAAQETTK